jgi:UDP-N-acetylglucosamine--N-acetylmuramyl-(pentapeptide) pyrophosphoryl-undecaprenol N-acetylglucosamine transferase
MSGPVMIMAGGTGGHVFPGLAVAHALQKQAVAVSWLGSANSFESKLVPERGVNFNAVQVGGVRGKSALQKLRAPWMLTRAVAQSVGIFRRLRPRAAISFGGFAAGPGGIAAILLGVPLFVHEQNRIPGFTNRMLAKLAKRVLCGFPDSFKHSEFIGNPVREDIVALPAPAQRFGTRQGALRLLCLGGSLGAKALNDLLPQALALMPADQRPEVRHQAGSKLIDTARSAYLNAGLDADVVVPFIADMAAAYAWADLVLCRAGALTIAELAAAGVGAILVPFPHAVDDHQTANAEWLLQAGAAQVVQQRDLSAEILAQLLQAQTRALCLTRAQAARAVAKTDAAERCAKLILATPQ